MTQMNPSGPDALSSDAVLFAGWNNPSPECIL